MFKNTKKTFFTTCILSTLSFNAYSFDPSKSLEELMNSRVYSASKKMENYFNTASASYVLTNEDIRRSGATSIPEALRAVPGVNVAKIGSNKWAVSIRGFNAQLANKLLVMIDGRTVYTPLFAGVNWDVQDVMLEDVERIEVIRGPGGTVWGANAVNGVINVVTKKAKDTQGDIVALTTGNEEEFIGSARRGGKIGKNGYFRAYAKYSQYDESEGINVDDAWNMAKSGFRFDNTINHDNEITIQGDVYHSKQDRNSIVPTDTSPFTEESLHKDQMKGGNIKFNWNKNEEKKNSKLQVYYDNVQRDIATLGQKRHTVDIEYQQDHEFGKNDFVWGAGYRMIKDNLVSTNSIEFEDEKMYSYTYNIFAQNRYNIIPDKLFIQAGSKVEYNNFTDSEVQPSIRLSWSPTKNQTLWSAVSHARRTPSRAEDSILLRTSYNDTFSSFVTRSGSETLDAEKLTAYEIGYRVAPTRNVLIDAALFYNQYEDLIGDNLNGLSSVVDNAGEGESYGFEIFSEMFLTKNWELSLGYSFLDVRLENHSSSTNEALLRATEDTSPTNQFSVKNHFSLNRTVSMDSNLYYISHLENTDAQNGETTKIDGYVKLDLNFTWRPNYNHEVSVVGHDLLDREHQEFYSPLFSRGSEIGRSFYIKYIHRF